MPGPVREGEEFPSEDEPLREEDVTRGDLLDDRIAEGDELPEPDDDNAA